MTRFAAGVMVAIATALTACGDSESGLSVIDEENSSISLTCGETSTWEAGVVANTGKQAVDVRSVRLASEEAGFALTSARAYYGRSNTIDEHRAKANLVGLRIPSSGSSLAELEDAAADATGWHLVVTIRTPLCPLRRKLRRGDGVPERIYTSPGDGLVVDYRLDGKNRTVKVGGSMTICAAPRGFECSPVTP